MRGLPIDKSYYICQTCNRIGKNACTSHKIEARDLYNLVNLVLSDIMEHGRMALQDTGVFYERLPHRLEQRYTIEGSSLKKEQTDNKTWMQAITDVLRIASCADSDVRGFIGEIRGYASITELDEMILDRLIDKSDISAGEVIDGEKVQKIRIVYNFMGEIAD